MSGWEWFGIAILAVFGVYILCRVGAAGWYKSKQQFDKGVIHGKR